MTSQPWAGILLFAFGILTVTAPFLPSHADFTAQSSAEEIRSFFQRDAGLQNLQAWLHAGPSLLLLGAVTLLHRRLRDAGPNGPTAANLALLSAGLLTLLNVVGFILVAGVIRSANEGFDAHTSLYLYNQAWALLAFAPVFLAPFLLASFHYAGAGSGLPRWTRAFSLGGAVLMAAIVAATAVYQAGPATFFGAILLVLWSVVVGVTLAVARAPGPTSAPPASARPRRAA